MQGAYAPAPLYTAPSRKRGLFPRSFKIGDPNAINGRKAWARSEILRWLKDRMAVRGQVATHAAGVEKRMCGAGSQARQTSLAR
jgi:hypothetical protein